MGGRGRSHLPKSKKTTSRRGERVWAIARKTQRGSGGEGRDDFWLGGNRLRGKPLLCLEVNRLPEKESDLLQEKKLQEWVFEGKKNPSRQKGGNFKHSIAGRTIPARREVDTKHVEREKTIEPPACFSQKRESDSINVRGR